MREETRCEGHGAGGHGWFVTFADLMGLLVAFFVMLVAFSTQDQVKLQIVAGSMRDAFGVQDRVRYSGVIELSGLPDPAEAQERRADSSRGGFGHSQSRRAAADISPTGRNSRAIAPLRLLRRRCAKPCRACPTSAEMSKHIMVEETKQGLNIEIVDQDGRSMFPEGSKEPYERRVA